MSEAQARQVLPKIPPKPLRRKDSGAKAIPLRSAPPPPTHSSPKKFNYDFKTKLQKSSSEEGTPTKESPIAAPRKHSRGQSLSKDPEFFFQSTLRAINKYQYKGLFCDVAIVYADEQFSAHEIVLAANSPYFEKLFLDNEHRKHERREIAVKEIKQEIMSLCLGFMYTGKITVTRDNAEGLLHAAKILQSRGIGEQCWEYLSRNINVETCVEIEELATIYENKNVQTLAKNYFLQHFTQAASTEAFLKLSVENVVEKMSSNDIEVTSEEDVYFAGFAWLYHDLSRRKRFVPDILKCIRLPLLPANFLVETAKDEPLIKNFVECRDMLEDAFASLLVTSNDVTKRKNPMTDQTKIYILNQISKKVHLYNPKEDSYKQLTDLPSTRPNCAIAGSGSTMFVLGGSSNQFADRYDVTEESSKWEPVPNDLGISSGEGMGAVVLEGILYVCGGIAWPITEVQLAKFDIASNQWSIGSPLATARAYHALVACQGSLFAIGGSDGNQIHNTAEQMDVGTQKWSRIAPMREKRTGLAAAVWEAKIYVMGGHNSESILDSVEVYSCQDAVWTLATNMIVPRSKFTACVVENEIYVLGGNNSSTIGIFNVEKGEWRERNSKEVGTENSVSVALTFK